MSPRFPLDARRTIHRPDSSCVVLSQIIAFSVVTHLYRTEMFPTFERARPGEQCHCPSKSHSLPSTYARRPGLRLEHRLMGSGYLRHHRCCHHRHICQQGPPVGCWQSGLPPHPRLSQPYPSRLCITIPPPLVIHARHHMFSSLVCTISGYRYSRSPQ